MHELSLAMALAEEAKKAAHQAGANRVISITVQVGKLAGVAEELLSSVFPIVVSGTELEGTELKIESVPLAITCQLCLKQSNPELPLIRCLHCGSRKFTVDFGREFLIKSIEIETDH